jgi:dTDP-4-amino-4,6-dideoxygalactose transaminase
MDPIPFHLPDIDETDVAAVTAVLRSRWLTTGDRCRQFENEFAASLQADGPIHAIATNSGTAAMHLALEACGIGPGDRVVVPVMTFTATAEVVHYLGADPLFVDVAIADSNLDAHGVANQVDALGARERERIRAIMPVHYGGLPCDMSAITTLADDRGWKVIDDAAHALPSAHLSRRIGTWGDVTAFSFYATKTLCTGEGGMVVTADPDLAERMKVMRLHGISRDAFDRYRSTEPAWAYEIVAPGFKYNLTDIAASLGITQLTKLDSALESRRAIADRYRRGFSDHPDLILPAPGDDKRLHSWHLYSLRIRGDRERRDRVIELMARDGIATSVHFIPLHRMPYWRNRYELSVQDFPVAEELFAGQISLPIYPALGEPDVDRVIDAVRRAIDATR